MSELSRGHSGSDPEGGASPGFSRPLLALILGQISLHACMAGVRMAAPLQALRQGHSEAAVGVLLALFALAPIALALPAGRMADRFGYHRPLRIAVALSLLGGVLAAVSGHFAVACAAALLTGAGANVGLITIQRRAGQMAGEQRGAHPDLQLARAGSGAGQCDRAGDRRAGDRPGAAFARHSRMLMLLPIGALLVARGVPPEAPKAPADESDSSGQPGMRRRRSWDLLLSPGMGRLMLTTG